MPLMTISTNLPRDKISPELMRKLSKMFQTEFTKPKEFTFVNVKAVSIDLQVGCLI